MNTTTRAVEAACAATYGRNWRATLCRLAGWSERFLERIMNGTNEPPDYFLGIVARVLRHTAALHDELSKDDIPQVRIDILIGERDSALAWAAEVEAVARTTERAA